MDLNYKTRRFLRILKIAIFSSILGIASVHALEKSNYLSNLDDKHLVSQSQKSNEKQLPTLTSCMAYFEDTVSANDCRAGEVPLPAASWLFLLALAGFVALSNKRKI